VATGRYRGRVDITVPAGESSDVSEDDAVTNASTIVQTLAHTTTGTAVAGIGVAGAMKVENGSGTLVNAVLRRGVLTTVTNGAEVGAYRVAVVNGGTVPAEGSEQLQIDGSGKITNRSASGTTTTMEMIYAGTQDAPRFHLCNASTGSTASDGTFFGASNTVDFSILNYETGQIILYTGGNPRWSISGVGVVTHADGVDLAVGTSTGTKFGTSTTQKIGFFNSTPIVKPTVTGSRGANAALASLCTQLAALGLIVDSTS
jgi:hypothetical protein